MSIKNPETERLTRELALVTGESLTTALTTAVQERLDRVRAHASDGDTAERTDRILALGRDIAERLVGPFATWDHGDLLYDDKGLPR